MTFNLEQVSAALNRAADEIKDQAGLDDTGAVDAMNLLVNATLQYLKGEAGTLEQVVGQSYDESYADVMSWCRDG